MAEPEFNNFFATLLSDQAIRVCNSNGADCGRIRILSIDESARKIVVDQLWVAPNHRYDSDVSDSGITALMGIVKDFGTPAEVAAGITIASAFVAGSNAAVDPIALTVDIGGLIIHYAEGHLDDVRSIVATGLGILPDAAPGYPPSMPFIHE